MCIIIFAFLLKVHFILKIVIFQYDLRCYHRGLYGSKPESFFISNFLHINNLLFSQWNPRREVRDKHRVLHQLHHLDAGGTPVAPRIPGIQFTTICLLLFRLCICLLLFRLCILYKYCLYIINIQSVYISCHLSVATTHLISIQFKSDFNLHCTLKY